METTKISFKEEPEPLKGDFYLAKYGNAIYLKYDTWYILVINKDGTISRAGAVPSGLGFQLDFDEKIVIREM